MLLDTIERCYLAFRRRRRDVRQATSCTCNACSRIPDLDLKFVVHHGSVIVQKVAGRQELLGPDVIVVHRLLKNEVVERLGMPAYAFLTQACTDAAGLDPAALGMTRHTETYDRIGEVTGWAHDLERRWQEEDARARVRVTPEDAVLDLAIPVRVPPQVAWEFLTTPGQRMSWQPWVTEVTVVDATGGRRGPGSANHCRHGADAVVEEILDWRPYDYVTDRTVLDTPEGSVKVLHTIELEATDEGTLIHLRFGAPRTKREQAQMAHIGPAYGAALESARARAGGPAGGPSRRAGPADLTYCPAPTAARASCAWASRVPSCTSGPGAGRFMGEEPGPPLPCRHRASRGRKTTWR